MPRGRPAKYNCTCKVSANAEAWKVKMVRKLGRSIGDLLNSAMDMVIMDAIQTNNPAITPEDVRTFKALVAFGIDDSLSRMVEQRRGDTPPEQFTDEDDAPDCDEISEPDQPLVTMDAPDGYQTGKPQGMDMTEAVEVLEEVLTDVPEVTVIDGYIEELDASYRRTEYDTIKVLQNLEEYLLIRLEKEKPNEIGNFISCTEFSLKPLEWWLKLQRKANRYGNDS